MPKVLIHFNEYFVKVGTNTGFVWQVGAKEQELQRLRLRLQTEETEGGEELEQRLQQFQQQTPLLESLQRELSSAQASRCSWFSLVRSVLFSVRWFCTCAESLSLPHFNYTAYGHTNLCTTLSGILANTLYFILMCLLCRMPSMHWRIRTANWSHNYCETFQITTSAMMRIVQHR